MEVCANRKEQKVSRKKDDLTKSKREEVKKEESDEDEIDPYDGLELAPGMKEGEFKFNKDSNDYILKDGFFLEGALYNKLFDH